MAWREPTFDNMEKLVKAFEIALKSQADVNIDQLNRLKQVLIAKARQEGIEIPSELMKEINE